MDRRILRTNFHKTPSVAAGGGRKRSRVVGYGKDDVTEQEIKRITVRTSGVSMEMDTR